MEDNAIKSALDAHFKAVEKAVEKYEGQVQEAGKASEEAKNEVKAVSEEFKAKLAEINATLTDLAQKADKAPEAKDKPLSAAEEFVRSDEFKALQEGKSRNARLETKNTVLADNTTTTWLDQRPGVVPGPFRPLTVYQALPQARTNTDTVVLMRETPATGFTNAARGVTEGQVKPESAVTFNKYNVPIETIAHWLKVSKQLMADAPAVVSYIEGRLRFGVEAEIDDQLLNGDGTSPNLSGLLDAGNFTAYTPTAGDNLIQAINRAKWQLWATGYVADMVIVNPADWGAQEIERESGATGMYLYGAPGTVSGMNPFGVRIVISTQMPAGEFWIGQSSIAATVWNREGTVVEMGYVDDDFIRNLITIRAEARLGLGVVVPAAALSGEFTASA